MAQFKDLIVNGPSVLVGGAYGNLNGTATKVGHTLTIGSQTFDGSANVTVPSST